ncbi:MAG: T9SS type A sorting domain-containing protein [Bacteroidota bacterium]
MNFEIELNDNDHRDLTWFSITGQRFGNQDPEHYMYFDDVRLFRQCDVDSACFTTTGQICPQIVTAPPPANPIEVNNISQAHSMRVRLFVPGTTSLVWDTTYSNRNGLPDVKIPAQLLATRLATNNYDAEISLENKCGAIVTSRPIQVMNGIFDTLSYWVDTTANWSEVPTPCCLRTLTLENLEIVGDVSYIVKDTIWVRDGVTAADSSNILIQACDVIELDSVEFDGTVSTVEILEAPCQSCRLAPPSSGGTAPDPAMIGTHGVVTASRPKPKPETSVRPSVVSDHQPVHSADRPGSQPSPDYQIGVWAYPNPFANSVTVEVELSRPGPVSLIVYDSGMREVARVIKGRDLPAGIHAYAADLSDHPAGLYIVQLVGEGQTITEKIVKQ